MMTDYKPNCKLVTQVYWIYTKSAKVAVKTKPLNLKI